MSGSKRNKRREVRAQFYLIEKLVAARGVFEALARVVEPVPELGQLRLQGRGQIEDAGAAVAAAPRRRPAARRRRARRLVQGGERRLLGAVLGVPGVALKLLQQLFAFDYLFLR